MMWPMARRPVSQYGVPPREHPPAQAPARLGEVPPPRGHPLGQASAPHVADAPRAHEVRPPPNLRTLKPVRRAVRGSLGDLFHIFPELPWPRRPTAVPNRDALRRRTVPRAVRRPVR
jgi:hypothetical protein